MSEHDETTHEGVHLDEASGTLVDGDGAPVKPQGQVYADEAAEGRPALLESPGEPESEEQGMVRTGRALPRHAGTEDSAGLVPEDTDARVAHTMAQRAETGLAVTQEGTRADGDVQGQVRSGGQQP